MPYYNIYGKIVFKDIPNPDELLTLAYRLVSKSIEYRLGINLYGNITSYLLKEFADFNYCRKNKYIPFEILDDPMSNECSEIFDGILIGQHDFIGVENSRLPILQDFLAEILGIECISHLVVNAIDKHSDSSALMTEYEIEADEFCGTWMNAPKVHSELGNVRFIVHQGKKSD